ncbi:DUF3179 domain-containing (seleno)protein [Halosolutus amylolyticus]|uniref:DUF3179 domain-containing (Seleno)protein n=1 Tax=Halosolutus amylolyticus TaxID=2932267 RepID=A0ABD5PIY4_9EURY|nr:DUF3179 domain-containing (seleno)protein [Halosolutus amylolyticus]
MNIRQVVPKDAIPSVDDPAFGTAYFGDGNDDVIDVKTTPTKSHPVCILDYHKIVNDVLDRGDETVLIAVIWCPLCGSGVVND